jgi:hypothetical protein
MDSLAYDRVQSAQNASPDAYVPSQINGDWISPLLKNIPGPDQQRCCKQD